MECWLFKPCYGVLVVQSLLWSVGCLGSCSFSDRFGMYYFHIQHVFELTLDVGKLGIRILIQIVTMDN